MNKQTRNLVLALVAAVGFGAMVPPAAMAQAVKSIRGADVAEQELQVGNYKPIPDQAPIERDYVQQPPLIPHKIDGYQISADNNACMTCHDWPGNTRVHAPKISETHYVDRQGARLDKVAGTRYFCTQCHVPQADAKPLVGNSFENATQVK